MSNRTMLKDLKRIIITLAVVGLVVLFAWFINARINPKETVRRANPYAQFVSAHDTESETESFEVANDRFSMAVDPETLGVTLTHKASGQSFGSTVGSEEEKLNTSWRGFLGSGVAIDFYNGDSPVVERADTMNRQPVIHVRKQPHGFRATLHYEKLELALDVVVTLTEDGFTAEVPAESIYEGKKGRLAAVYLYPFLGAARADQEKGYVLVPEGTGALMPLKDNEKRYRTPLIKKIYGKDLAVDPQISQQDNRPSITEPGTLTVPVYGIVHTDKQLAFLGIARDGKYTAEMLAYPNGVITDYTWAGIRFIYREDYITPLSKATGVRTAPQSGNFRDVSIRFKVLSGEDADYVGLAKAYRDYLHEEGSLHPAKARPTVRLDFLGAETRQSLLHEEVFAATTIDDMGKMLDALHHDGVTSILPIYRGWQEHGASRSLGQTRQALEKKLGSEDQLRHLADTLLGRDQRLLLHADLLHANPKNRYDTTTDLVKNMSKNVVETSEPGPLYPSFYLLTPQGSKPQAEALSERIVDDGPFGLALSGHTNRLSASYNQGLITYRDEMSEQTIQLVDTLEAPLTALEAPFDYMYPHMDSYLDLSVSEPEYNFLETQIPFLPLVLQGDVPLYSTYLNFEANLKNTQLKLIEYGVRPSFILTEVEAAELKESHASEIFTSTFSHFKDLIVEFSDTFETIWAVVDGADMIRHEYVTSQISKVEYANGTTVYVNYRPVESQVDDYEIPAHGFLVVEGGTDE